MPASAIDKRIRLCAEGPVFANVYEPLAEFNHAVRVKKFLIKDELIVIVEAIEITAEVPSRLAEPVRKPT